MSELRQDPFSRRWVIISTERGRRPSEFIQDRERPTDPGSCPFCPGNEHATPPEIAVIRPGGGKPNGPGWEARVFPNKYPALAIEGDTDKRAVGLYDRMRGIGAHEVIVDSPKHDCHYADMDPVHLEKVLALYQARLEDLYRDVRFKYALIFKSHGAAAGASVGHPHTQIIATPVTPRSVAIELDSARDHYSLKTRCLYCDVLNQELESGERVISLDEHYAVLAPYASTFPFETMVIPRRHCHSFAEEPRPSLAALARCLRDLAARMRSVLRDPPYNFTFHTSPNVNAEGRRKDYWYTIRADYHWHIRVMPRLIRTTGFEWGTGLYINPTSPEEVAKYLIDAVL